MIDLDALTPPKASIKFGGQEIEVNPPKTGDILRLGALGQKLSDVDASAADIDKLVADLTNIIRRCIPELGDKELNTQQLLKLIEMLSKMAIPPDVKELKKKGISVGDPKAP